MPGRFDKELAQFLIIDGIDVNRSDNCDYTPLHFAARHRQVDIAELLLANGANASATNSLDMTAEQIARRVGNIDLANMIRNYELLHVKEPEPLTL